MKAYRVLAQIIAGLVVVQAALVAFGWFDVLSSVDGGEAFTEDSDFPAGLIGHAIVGMTLMPLLGLVLLITSFFTKTAGASKRAGLVLGAIVLQVVLAFVGFGVPFVGLLHGLNAFVVLGVAVYASRLTASSTTLSAPRETTAV